MIPNNGTEVWDTSHVHLRLGMALPMLVQNPGVPTSVS